MRFVDQLTPYFRFALGLRRFLNHPVTPEESRRIILRRFGNRRQNLMDVVRRGIFENPASPYLPLLAAAGCQYGDFEKMLLRNGVESTLSELSKNGVYLTCDEFKGRRDVVRSGKTFAFSPRDFDNPLLRGHLEGRTGASRGSGVRTIYDFAFLAAGWTVYLSQMMAGLGVMDAPFGIWFPIMPGAGPVALLTYLKAGKKPDKWFSPLHATGFRPSVKNRAGNAFILHMGNILRPGLPRPEIISVENAFRVALWMKEMIRKHGGSWLTTYTTLAARVCRQARRHGLDLSGATFIANGEPLTDAKRREIVGANARVYPIYGTMETGAIGLGCFHPSGPDDVHVLRDSVALVQHRREVAHARTSVDALLVTTLLREAPKIMLNVETGDYGTLSASRCGCMLEGLGCRDRMSGVRSFEKMTGEGMTFYGTDLLRIIEEELPARFGGTSSDYQMVEEENENGDTRLYLCISPDVGPIAEKEAIETVLQTLRRGKDEMRMMTALWQQAGTLRVRRARPVFTARGKLLPLHIHKRIFAGGHRIPQ